MSPSESMRLKIGVGEGGELVSASIMIYVSRMEVACDMLPMYKTSSQALLSLCKRYARCAARFSQHLEETLHYPTIKADGKHRSVDLVTADIHNWYDAVTRYFAYWSSRDFVSAIESWRRMSRELAELIRVCPQQIQSMDALMSVRPLTEDDPNVRETLDIIETILCNPTMAQTLADLEDASLKTIIELLDQVLDIIECPSRLHTRVFHTLRKLCMKTRSLPHSFTLLSEDLTKKQEYAIAGGGFADVWLGSYKGRDVALKVLRVYPGDELSKIQEKFCKETVHWKRLRHPNIVQFLGVSSSLFQLCMVSEWMPNGNIVTYLKRNTEADRLGLLIDVASGLEYLHGNGIVHGDLKGGNILIDELHRARLADFGLASVIYTSDTISTITTSSQRNGSTRWMAPELLNPEQSGLEKAMPTLRSDIYSLSMVMWEVFVGHVPFFEIIREATVIISVLQGKRPDRPPSTTRIGLSDTIWGLMQDCWHADLNRRPEAQAVLICLLETHPSDTATLVKPQVATRSTRSRASSSATLAPDSPVTNSGVSVLSSKTLSTKKSSLAWYLQDERDPNAIILSQTGEIQAGTPAALVEQLTDHAHGNAIFKRNFLMTFKMFMSVEELIEMLVQRFWILPPTGLSLSDRFDWTLAKQDVVRMRVLDTLKNLVMSDGILEQDNGFVVLTPDEAVAINKFLSHPEVAALRGAAQLRATIEGINQRRLLYARWSPVNPMQPSTRSQPDTSVGSLKPHRLAQELTLQSSAMFNAIKPAEWLQYMKGNISNRSNLDAAIQFYDKTVLWVKCAVMLPKTTRRRVQTLRLFIKLCDQCRYMHNFFTMSAIISALESPLLRRAIHSKVVWDQIEPYYLDQLQNCQAALDIDNFFRQYSFNMSRNVTPCVPIVGVYLMILSFINEGSEDNMPDDMVDFRKCQRVADILQDIKQRQTKVYAYKSDSHVATYLQSWFAAAQSCLQALLGGLNENCLSQDFMASVWMWEDKNRKVKLK